MSEELWPLVVAHRERLLRVARRRCPTREDAEDVVSEAMLRCATFEGLDVARLEQFLTAVTVRLCADVHRKAQRRARAVVKLATHPDVAPSPEDELYGGVDEAVLRQLLAALPPRQRAVLADRAHGLTVTQIARRHALSYKAAESALARARHAMRSALGAATAAVVAVRAAWRPRRAAVVAVPLATLSLGAAVLTLPLPGGGTTEGALPDRVLVVAPRSSAELPRRAPAPAPAAGPAYVAAPAPRAAVAPGPPARPRPKEFGVGDEDDPVYVKVKHRPQTPQSRVEYLQGCVERGAWVSVELHPGEIGGEPGGSPGGVKQGCG